MFSNNQLLLPAVGVLMWRLIAGAWNSSFHSLCAICSQHVGCHGSPSFSILCHFDTVIIWYFCSFLDVIRPHCSRSPPSPSTTYPSFHQQSLYPISSYYMSKILTFPFLIVFNNDLLVFILRKTSPLVLCSFHNILNILLYSHISKASNLSEILLLYPIGIVWNNNPRKVGHYLVDVYESTVDGVSEQTRRLVRSCHPCPTDKIRCLTCYHMSG